VAGRFRSFEESLTEFCRWGLEESGLCRLGGTGVTFSGVYYVKLFLCSTLSKAGEFATVFVFTFLELSTFSVLGSYFKLTFSISSFFWSKGEWVVSSRR